MATDISSLMVIRDVTPDITTLSIPVDFLGGRARVGGRATVVRLQTGSLAVFSAVHLTPEVRAKLQSLGTVRYIVALNIQHHLHISAWAREFPDAHVVGMEGLPEKREQKPETAGVHFGTVFSAENKSSLRISDEFDAEFSYEYLEASMNKEIVFLHKPTRTLIEGDVIFNLPCKEQYSRTDEGSSGLLNKLLVHMFQTSGSLDWQRRILWYGASKATRASVGESLKTIERWEFDRIIPCHGDTIETGGKAVFEGIAKMYLDSQN
ncbi:hypothetical protein GQ53DRAFT_755268 [Thozetella sp. PMI_491]|nr:hypothetical protein GQ53DRAFT_755268 [Thozetella sp. PMI_491]